MIKLQWRNNMVLSSTISSYIFSKIGSMHMYRGSMNLYSMIKLGITSKTK